MTATTISSLEKTIQKTNLWLEQLSEEMHMDREHAYRCLRAVLHALRDRLTVEETSDLAAQLPLLVRGIYYESWNPSKTPTADRNLAAFLDRVASELKGGIAIDPERATRAIFKLLAEHCSDGQIKHVRGNLPQDVQSLWPH